MAVGRKAKESVMMKNTKNSPNIIIILLIAYESSKTLSHRVKPLSAQRSTLTTFVSGIFIFAFPVDRYFLQVDAMIILTLYIVPKIVVKATSKNSTAILA